MEIAIFIIIIAFVIPILIANRYKKYLLKEAIKSQKSITNGVIVDYLDISLSHYFNSRSHIKYNRHRFRLIAEFEVNGKIYRCVSFEEFNAGIDGRFRFAEIPIGSEVVINYNENNPTDARISLTNQYKEEHFKNVSMYWILLFLSILFLAFLMLRNYL